MSVLVPSFVQELDPDAYFPPGPALERLILGRARRQLVEVLTFERSPSRLLRCGRDAVSLEDQFPEATVRDGELPESGPPAWAGWPDVLWLDYALSGCPDPEATIRALWRALPPGASIAVVDAHRTTRTTTGRWLAETLGLVPDPSVLALLRAAFSPVHVSLLDHQGGLWQSFVFVGQRTGSSGPPM